LIPINPIEAGGRSKESNIGKRDGKIDLEKQSDYYERNL